MDKSRYQSPWHASRQWGRAWATVKGWCRRGLIPGVIELNGRFYIPIDAVEPNVPPLAPEVRQEHKRRRMAARRITGRSGYRGVIARHSRWAAIISIEGRAVHIGTYDTPEEAARAFDKRARELRGPGALVNFPDDS